MTRTTNPFEPVPTGKRKRKRNEPGVREDALLDLVDDPLQLDWQKRRTPWGKRLLWLLLILLAGAALAGRYIANHFDELARQDQYRPIFQQLCPHIGCTVPSKVDIDRIKSSNLVVRSHPGVRRGAGGRCNPLQPRTVLPAFPAAGTAVRRSARQNDR